MSEPTWLLSGDYFENCNCDILCPCIHNPQAAPTVGHCDVALAFHIDRGYFEQTVLDGLNFMVALWTPTVMAQGNWKTAVYVDERADEAQRQAFEQILSGHMGGPAERWMRLTATFLGTRYVPITYSIDGTKRQVRIPNVIDFTIEGILARGQHAVMTLTHTAHPVSSSLALAKGTQSTYTDHGMAWDNTGKNGHYAAFQWQWPA